MAALTGIPNGDISASVAAPSIEVKNLTFTFPDSAFGLHDVSLSLPPGSRTLLIGGKAL